MAAVPGLIIGRTRGLMGPPECIPATACPAIQVPTPLVVAPRSPAARLTVEAWVTAAVLAVLAVLAADMANRRSRYRSDRM
jgi:hypothetical protein